MAAKKHKANRDRVKKPAGLKTLNSMKSTKKQKKSNNAAMDRRNTKSGPHLPSSFLKELGLQKPALNLSDQEDADQESEDLYEYEEMLPEEETKKNRRYDPVENYEYELPDDFEDEDVPSDDDVDEEHSSSDEDDDAADKEGDDQDASEKHVRMLQSITGLPAEAFKYKENKEATLSGVQGDSGGRQISINDLLDPLHGKAGYSKLRKRLHQLENSQMVVQAPLPKVEREKLERKVAYEHSKKEITKWEPLVKRNREVPTLYLGEDIDLGVRTVGAIAAEHKPRTDFEKKMAALVGAPEVIQAYKNDGIKLLELNKVSVEDVRNRQNSLAKMRSLLFRHEMKAKHIKNIKSKTYHRILKKEKQKISSTEVNVDSEIAKELAIKQEFKRAEERMTLKHKNSSKWAKRIFKRGLKAQDEGTRTAIADQLHQHALLTRKINSMNENSSSDEISDDDSSDMSHGFDSEGVSKLLNKAKEKTNKIMEEEDEMPKVGVFALPFMERSLKKQREAANEEARLALQEYESTLGKLGGDDVDPLIDRRCGRRVFVGAKSLPMIPSTEKPKRHDDSGSEGDFDVREEEDEHKVETGPHDVQIKSTLFPDDAEAAQETIYKNFDDIIKSPGSKTTYDVAIFASGSWKKLGGKVQADNIKEKPAAADNVILPEHDSEVQDADSDSDSDLEMVDGHLSSHPKSDDYELPSQNDLVRRAFASDDIEMEFEKDKMEALNEENPEPEKPVLLPGWGQWTHIQQKRGIPSIITEEHEIAKRMREEANKKRKDANLKHVIISEKIDKKVEKLHAKNLPFPFTSKEVYEQSIRMPIGPDYNPAVSIRALNRPAVVKRAGVVINPIKYEDIDPHGKSKTAKAPKHPREKKKPKSKTTKVDRRKASKKSS